MTSLPQACCRHLHLGNYNDGIIPNYVSPLLGRSHALEAALDWRP
jgi:hypothetical protein